MTQGWAQRPGVWRAAKCGGQCRAADIMNSKDKLCVVFVRGQWGTQWGWLPHGSTLPCSSPECRAPAVVAPLSAPPPACMHGQHGPRRWERHRSSSQITDN